MTLLRPTAPTRFDFIDLYGKLILLFSMEMWKETQKPRSWLGCPGAMTKEPAEEQDRDAETRNTGGGERGG